MASTQDFYFVGKGDTAELEAKKQLIQPWEGKIGPWKRRRGDSGVLDNAKRPPEHPANYAASTPLADAVNTSIALGKPLLVTGNPGTGKSQLAERIAWELNLGPVLRFEAQSLSEANDLFYRFDLVGYLSAVELFKASPQSSQPGAEALLTVPVAPTPDLFLKLGPLGEAIVRSDPRTHNKIFDAAFSPGESSASAEPRPSVVLIDEIDKASRDFPNDLLNGIERREFAIRELRIESVPANPDYPPIVIITSNSERDLPAPFLRRCTFFHIDDPTSEMLESILIRKFSPCWSGDGATGAPRTQLPNLYHQLLQQFGLYRERQKGTLQYSPGTSELIDWTQALILKNARQDAELTAELDKVKRSASTVAKHHDDLTALTTFLDGLAAPKTT